ncbi:MAG: glycosyltransferase family 2 protein [Phycisphaeraceae bacterium]|nr:glycosyltransferase family 2 protein [Phycisphaeraceae bacterium]
MKSASTRSSPGAMTEPKPLGSPGNRAVRRVTSVSPCFNAPRDIEQLYQDLAALDLTLPGGGTIELSVIVVDNASNEPISAIAPPPGLRVTVVRLDSNTGGSGGYNAGMARAVLDGRSGREPPEFVWLLDSDARPDSAALVALIRAMDARPGYVLMGSSIARPIDGTVFEIGGRVDRFLGQYHPCYGEHRRPPGRIVDVQYAAACSALVRREAIETVGLFPDVFLNGDDVEWSIRLARETGMKVGACVDSVVRHPQMKFGPTLVRYFISRNAFGPINALRLGPRVRLFRAIREVPRGLAQAMIGRDDLAELHIRGLEDAARGSLWGKGSAGDVPLDRFETFDALPDRLGPLLDDIKTRQVWLHGRVRLEASAARELEAALDRLGLEAPPIPRGEYIMEHERFYTGLRRAVWRLIRGPKKRVAIIPVRGRPNAWCRGLIQVEVTPTSFIIRRANRRRMLGRVVALGSRGLWAALRITLRPAPRSSSERLRRVEDYAEAVGHREAHVRIDGTSAPLAAAS